MTKQLVIGLAVLAVAVFFLFGSQIKDSFSGSISGNVVRAEMIDEGDYVKIPLSGISDKVEYYTYDDAGVGIEFFVVEDANGNVKTAFNACDVCYGAKKGYRQEGVDMVCNNCGNHYAISQLGTANLKGGGCWPGYLRTTIEGDYLIIQKSDIQTGRYRFA